MPSRTIRRNRGQRQVRSRGGRDGNLRPSIIPVKPATDWSICPKSSRVRGKARKALPARLRQGRPTPKPQRVSLSVQSSRSAGSRYIQEVELAVTRSARRAVEPQSLRVQPLARLQRQVRQRLLHSTRAPDRQSVARRQIRSSRDLEAQRSSVRSHALGARHGSKSLRAYLPLRVRYHNPPDAAETKSDNPEERKGTSPAARMLRERSSEHSKNPAAPILIPSANTAVPVPFRAR